MGENGRIGRALLVWAKIDGFLESLFGPIFLIPAKAGIQLIQVVLDSCFRRSDGFPDFLRDHQNLCPKFLSRR